MQINANISASYDKSRSEAHQAFLGVFNAASVELTNMYATYGPNYDSFAAAVAAFPFNKLTNATNKALKAVTDSADYLLHYGALQINPNGPQSSLNSIWSIGMFGTRVQEGTTVDQWFTGSLYQFIGLIQRQVNDSNDACLLKYQADLESFVPTIANVLILPIKAEAPLVHNRYTNTRNAIVPAIAQTKNLIQVLKTCGVTTATLTTENCIKNFVSSFS